MKSKLDRRKENHDPREDSNARELCEKQRVKDELSEKQRKCSKMGNLKSPAALDELPEIFLRIASVIGERSCSATIGITILYW